jgi:hypothetical protein
MLLSYAAAGVDSRRRRGLPTQHMQVLAAVSIVWPPWVFVWSQVPAGGGGHCCVHAMYTLGVLATGERAVVVCLWLYLRVARAVWSREGNLAAPPFCLLGELQSSRYVPICAQQSDAQQVFCSVCLAMPACAERVVLPCTVAHA